MNTKQILDTIFKYHDELSHASVFMEKAKDRQICFTKAEATREIFEMIREQADNKKFDEAVEAHFNAFSKSIFYKRRLNLDGDL